MQLAPLSNASDLDLDIALEYVLLDLIGFAPQPDPVDWESAPLSPEDSAWLDAFLSGELDG